MTLKKYKCTVSFQKCAKLPDFSTEVEASSEYFAKEAAILCARKCDYKGSVKNVHVKEIQE